MKYLFTFFMLGIGAVGTLFSTTYYVSPVGDNNNPGTASQPFLTIQHAADLMVYGDTCLIETGTYPEQVTPGTNGQTFKAAPDASVEVTGFQEVSNWSLHTGNIYVAQLDWSLGDRNQLMLGGQVMNLARWPNKTNFNPFDLEAVKTTGTNSSLSDSNIPDIAWENGGKVFFLGKSRWTSWRVPITASSSGQVSFNTLSSNWQYAGSHSPTNGGEFYLMNVLEALDSPGEWYLEASTKKLYFWAPGGGNPSQQEVLFKRRTLAFNLGNRSEISLDSLTITGAYINLRDADACKVINCNVFYANHSISSNSAAFVSETSIFLNENSTNNLIQHNNIQWGAGNGIVLNGIDNLVDNNYIGNFNYLGSYACPVELRGTNTLSRNEIFNAGRDCIRGGGDGADCSYNDIHHSNIINDDCGGIYTCCNSYNNTRIHHNWIHDIYSRNEHYNSYKGTGVYLDNTTEDVIVDHNVMWNLEWACIQINWAGTNLLLYNNTLWSNSGPESSAMGRWVNGYTFTNVPLYNTLANEGEFHTTDAQNNIVLGLTDDPFEGYADQNFVPKAGESAIDAGRVISGYTDGYIGSSPDVGAYERGDMAWIPGPDWILATPTTSIESSWEEESIAIYPNPSQTGSITIKMELARPRNIEMIDVQGNLVYRGQSDNRSVTISVDSLASGIYFVKLSSKTQSSWHKVVLQN